MQQLVQAGADVNATVDLCKSSLLSAAARGYLDVVRFLVEKGANVNATYMFVGTPLHSAADGGHLDVGCFLVTECGADVKATDDLNGTTPLHSAVARGHLDVVRLLVELGADVNTVDNDGRTPLHLAAFWNKLVVVRCLVTECDADIDATATEEWSEEIAEYLESVGRVQTAVDSVGGEWRPHNHEGLPKAYRDAIKTLLSLGRIGVAM